MTTQVIVKTHDWPVAVQRRNPDNGLAFAGVETVPPHAEVNFYISQTTALDVRELPLPEKN